MSTDGAYRREPPCRSLGEYIRLLIERLGEAEPQGLERMRQIVGSRRARISLDDETVDVIFQDGRLVVEAPLPGRPIAGHGTTDRQTTLDLLDGHLEVNDAIVDSRLDVEGGVEEVSRMFLAIEVLIDASTRVPGLQRLARDYRLDPCRTGRSGSGPPGSYRRVSFLGDGPAEKERAMLRRLDLLP